MKREEKVQQLQMIEQSLTNLLMQRQQFQTQKIEAESALKEIKDTTEVYRIIGNIMVKGEKEKLNSELEKKKEIIELRIKNLQKQEENLKDKAKKLQSEVMTDLKGEENERR